MHYHEWDLRPPLPDRCRGLPFLSLPRASLEENADRLGGEGGALFTDINSESFSSTIFRRRTVMHLNLASSGGAIYNGGDTRLESQGFFRGNEAVVKSQKSQTYSLPGVYLYEVYIYSQNEKNKMAT